MLIINMLEVNIIRKFNKIYNRGLGVSYWTIDHWVVVFYFDSRSVVEVLHKTGIHTSANYLTT